MGKSKKNKVQNPVSSKGTKTCNCTQEKKSEIIISVASNSLVYINVNAEQCDSKVSEQFENHKIKVFVPTPSGSYDEMLLVTKQNYDEFVDYKRKKKSYTEFLNFEELLASNYYIVYSKVVKIDKDLFNMPKKTSLALCVAEDFIMDNEISMRFSAQFKRHGELFNQRQKQGGLAILSFPSRFIYYLVVKKYFVSNPTLFDTWNSLIKMRNHVQENNIKRVAIPRTGFKGLEWNDVDFMIEHIFKDTDVAIFVCNLKQEENAVPAGNIIRKCKIVYVPFPVGVIEPHTMIVYFGTEDGFVSSAMKELNKRFGILPDYQRGPRTLGQVVRTEAFNGRYLVIGFIVRKSSEDVVDYTYVEKCAKQLNKINKSFGKQRYEYLALDMFTDPPDEEMQFHNVIEILRIMLTDVDIYACYPKDVHKSNYF